MRFIPRKELFVGHMLEQMKKFEATGMEHSKFVLNTCVGCTSCNEIERDKRVLGMILSRRLRVCLGGLSCSASHTYLLARMMWT